MAYTLQAFIAESGCLVNHGIPNARIRELNDALSILPLADPLPGQLGIGELPLTDGKLNAVEAITRLGVEFSKSGRVAYVEAEYFGGSGTQANCLFELGKLVKGPVVSGQAINEALRFLGVKAARRSDEFDTVHLGQHASTDEWLDDWVDSDEWRRDT